MRTAYRLAGILAIVAASGCATRRPWSRADHETPALPAVAPEKPDAPAFTFVVQSDPAGADVYQATSKGERLLGKTPLTISLKLMRKRGEGLLGMLRRGSWQTYIPENVPITFREVDNLVTVRIPELQLRKGGYKPETFAHQWKFPASLKQSVSRWKSAPVPRRYEETVVFRTPIQPQFSTTVELDSASGKASIHAINAKGGLGRLVGSTPLLCKVGYGPIRAASGEVTDWVRWHEKDADLFTHSRTGDLLLNCILVRDGYEPEKVLNRKLFSLQIQQPPKVTQVLQLVQPNKPEANVKMRVDSLPSAAAVYAVNPDGSLGREVAKTPFEFTIGLAQESAEESSGRYVHKDWRIWAPDGIVTWQAGPDGTTLFRLTCAIYKDGFAVETVAQPLFQLAPGEPYPEGRTLTIPLPRPEQAAVRESHRLEQARARAAEQKRAEGVVWQAPPEQPVPQPGTGPEGDAPKKRGTRVGRWWRGLWHRD